jgi:uncharacterized protein YbjT (DUF2867 family)
MGNSSTDSRSQLFNSLSPFLHLTILAVKSEALKATYPGVEVVRGDLDDPASLAEAFKGVYVVFGVTNFWEHGADAEIRQGKALVDAAKAAAVKHFVWSTLDNGDPQIVHWVTKWTIDGILE